jgi:hypothetical protein
MQVFLDDRPITVERDSLSAAVRAAAAAAARNGRIVVEATCAGETVSDEQLQNPGDDAWTRGDIRFVSVEPRSLIRVTLMDAADALETAKSDQLECARLIQSGELDASLAPLGGAIETWRAVREAVEKSIELLGDAAVDAERLQALVQGLSSRLEEIRRSLAAQDWSSLADVLAYDMVEQVEQWRGLLTSMSERVRAAAGGRGES